MAAPPTVYFSQHVEVQNSADCLQYGQSKEQVLGCYCAGWHIQVLLMGLAMQLAICRVMLQSCRLTNIVLNAPW